MHNRKLYPCEIEAIFQLCNANFSSGNFEKAAMYHDMLNYEIDRNFDLVNETLIPAKKKRFSYIQDYFEGVDEGFKRIPKMMNRGKTRITKKLVNEENDLKKLLNENIHQLEKVTGKLKYIGQEIRVSSEEKDKCDMAFLNDRKLYVVELKKDIADHAVVTQIDKYMKRFWQKAFIFNHDYVEGIVVAAKFTNYAYDHLKKNGIICFQYNFGDTFNLIQI